VYFAIKITLERQVDLDDDEAAIHQSHFSDEMMDYEFQKIIRVGEIITVNRPSRILHAGDMHENLFFVLDGEMMVSFADESHVHVPAGSFIGEGSFIGKPRKCKSTVDALPGCRYVKWNYKRIHELVQKSAQARRALEVKIGRELGAKLRKTSARLSHAEHELLVYKLCFGSKKDTVEEALTDAFKQFDRDGGGTLDFTEFSNMMKKMAGDNVTYLQLRNLFDAVDTDRGGSISIEEFLAWMRK